MIGKRKVSFPNGFFTKDRPVVTNKEALKDVIPIKWSNEVKNQKKKTVIYSSEEKKVL